MYLGNQPALNFTSLATQTFSAVTGQTQYSLDHSVANGNDILLYISNVKQVEGSGNSYTASGNTLTLTTPISAGTEMYCLYLSKAIQTVKPPNGSVGTAQLASGVLPTNTPAWYARLTTDQSLSSNTHTKIQFNTEVYDTDSAYDTSTGRFTCPTGKDGKYFVTASAYTLPGGEADLSYSTLTIKKNGSFVLERHQDFRSYRIYNFTNTVTGVLDLSASDYLEAFIYVSGTTAVKLENNNASSGTLTTFAGFKIIE